MAENSLDSDFFIIDSEHLDKVISGFYGFCISKNGFITRSNFSSHQNDLNGRGSYISVVVSYDRIYISQDLLSTFLIFIFKKDERFVLSNSFWKLCEYLCDSGESLSLNQIYCSQYFNTPLASLSVKNTLSNEITILEPFCSIEILIHSKNLSIKKKIIEFESVNLDSVEGVKIFNNWFNRWVSFISFLHHENYPLQVDLTGGYDSRTIFSIAYAAGVDFTSKYVNVHSIVPNTKGQKDQYKGDYEIASMISKFFDFELNKNECILRGKKYDSNIAYDIFKNTFLGFHQEGYFETDYYESPIFHLNGFNGEPVRGKVRNIKSWISNVSNKFGFSDSTCMELFKDYNEILKKSNSEYDALRKFYLSTWARNHYGMTIYRNFLIGKYSLCPFNDVDLYKLRLPDGIDKNAIFALIIYKASKYLMDVPFADGTSFSDTTKDFVKNLFEKYPELEDISISYGNYTILPKMSISSSGFYTDPDEILYQKFKNEENKRQFLIRFGKHGLEYYRFADKFFNCKDNFFWNKYVVVIVAIMEMLKLEKKSLLVNDTQRIMYEDLVRLKNNKEKCIILLIKKILRKPYRFIRKVLSL